MSHPFLGKDMKLTVKKLRKLLKGADPDAIVLINGDHQGPSRVYGVAIDQVFSADESDYQFDWCHPDDIDDYCVDPETATSCVVLKGLS